MTSTTRRKPNPLRKWVKHIDRLEVSALSWEAGIAVEVMATDALGSVRRKALARDIQRVLDKALKEAGE